MLNLCFCLGALLLFTIGSFLVKKGRPFARVGGDAYAKRRRRRMLGWMMWTTAGVMMLLAVINLATTGLPSTTGLAQSGARPDIEEVRSTDYAAQLIPNLIHAPSLEAHATPAAPSTNAPASIAPALDLSMTTRPPTLGPTMMTPPVPLAPPEPSDDAVAPKTDLASTAYSAGETVRPTPVVAPSAPVVLPSEPAPLAPQRQKELDAQMAAANLVLQQDPKNAGAYILRGNVNAYERKWEPAKADYKQALVLLPGSSSARFNLADIDFMQGHYDAARPGFATLVNDPDFADLAKYNVFLCDLFGGHEDLAAKELAVFNDIGSEASYYFANVAWSFYHRKVADAQNWLQSATQIFSASKVDLYAKPLIDLGYINNAAT